MRIEDGVKLDFKDGMSRPTYFAGPRIAPLLLNSIHTRAVWELRLAPSTFEHACASQKSVHILHCSMACCLAWPPPRCWLTRPAACSIDLVSQRGTTARPLMQSSLQHRCCCQHPYELALHGVGDGHKQKQLHARLSSNTMLLHGATPLSHHHHVPSCHHRAVLIRPKRSTLKSRSEVDIQRTFTFKHSKRTWTGVPMMASNMVGGCCCCCCCWWWWWWWSPGGGGCGCGGGGGQASQ
jgi:hypothetical protein